MVSASTARRPLLVRTCCAILLLPAGFCLCGCSFGWLFGQDPHTQFVGPPANCGMSELVSHLNANTAMLAAWRSTDVSIRARGTAGLPVKLSAVIAVERPRNLRLMVSSIQGNETDLGSNSERFWFWMRRGEPKHVFTATHERLHDAQRRLRIPFEPDWLMEVLGVVPLDETQVTMHAPAADGTVTLESQRFGPDGQPMRKLTIVDARQGLVLSHSLYDARGTLLASAALGKHRSHPLADGTSVVLPHEIALDWPHAGMALTLTVGQVEVNPQGLPESTWRMPQIPNYPPFDLGR